MIYGGVFCCCFFVELILCRIFVCFWYFFLLVRLDIIRNKFGEIKVGKILLEEEYIDRIGIYVENFCIISIEFMDCFEENYGDNMYFEIYFINELEF